MREVTISLPDDVVAQLDELVATGAFAGHDDAVKAAVGELAVRHQRDVDRLAELREAVSAGMADIRAGRIVELDSEDFLQDHLRRHQPTPRL